MSVFAELKNKLTKIDWKQIALQFGIPHFHRFEVVIMRVLFAYVLYQCMPLGEPFSSGGVRIIEAITPENEIAAFVGDPENNEILRPPLPPLSSLIPNSENSLSFDTQPKPDGIAKFFDLTFFSDPSFIKILPWIVLPCLVLYMIGIGLPVVLPILAFVLIGSRTLYNSQGYIHHGFQMVSLVLLAQTVISLWALWKHPKEAMGFAPAKGITKHGRTWWDVIVRYSQLMIIASYMIPGVIKQFKSGGEWFLNSHYIGVQVVKTHRQNYYNDLDEQWAKEEVPAMANFMLERKNLTRLLLGCGVGLQLIAFLALHNRLTMSIFGLSFVAFHYLNDLMFGLFFYHVEKMDWIFLVNLPFWVYFLARKGKGYEVDLTGTQIAADLK